MIDIQFQDSTGNWRTVIVTQNISAMILSNMQSLQQSYPGSRIRAIDQAGRVVDIL